MGLCWVVDDINAKIMLTETRQKFVSPSHKTTQRVQNRCGTPWARNQAPAVFLLHKVCSQTHGLRGWHPHSKQHDGRTKEKSIT